MTRPSHEFEDPDLPSNAWSDHLLTVLQDRFGHEVPLRRLGELRHLVRRLAAPAGFATPQQYVLALQSCELSEPATQALIRSLTIKESYFFRDRPAMSSLRDTLLPQLIEQRRDSKVLRVWSAGCSTGEELYSISILLDELLPDREQWSLSLVGTDLDAHAVAHARAARYKPWSMRVVLPEERLRYFHEDTATGLLRLRSRYQKDTSFHVHNLVAGKDSIPSPARFDLILCRNVLIYFSIEGQREVASTFREALTPGGLWITGASDPSPGAPWQTAIHPGLIAHTLDEQFGERPTLDRTGQRTLRPATSGTAFIPHAPSAVASSAVQQRSLATTDRPPSRSFEHGPLLLAAAPILSPVTTPTEGTSSVTVTDEQQLDAVMRLADAGKLSDAAKLCQTLTERLPLWPRPHLLAATIAQSAGQASDAIAHLKRALYLQPRDAEAQLRLGLLLAQTGAREAAIKALRNVMLYCQSPDASVRADISSTASRLLVQLLREEQT